MAGSNSTKHEHHLLGTVDSGKSHQSGLLAYHRSFKRLCGRHSVSEESSSTMIKAVFIIVEVTFRAVFSEGPFSDKDSRNLCGKRLIKFCHHPIFCT